MAERSFGPANTPVVFLAHLQKVSGGVLSSVTQSDVTSIVYSIIWVKTRYPVLNYDRVSATVSSVILDTPITTTTDSRWWKSGQSNYVHEVPGAAFPQEGLYWYDATITLTGNKRIFILRNHEVWQNAA